MCSILIFGGTTEGRELAELCAQNRIPACVSVATDYGASMLRGVRVLTGRLTEARMLKLIREKGFWLVIDATHPFAREAHINIRAACERAGARLIRVVRRGGDGAEGRYFDSVEDIVAYLSEREGGVLITTGSKELAAFCGLEDYPRRCAVRVLPDGVGRCLELGFAPERIIAGKGPFSKETNVSHMKRFGVRYLVTKDSGDVGGFGEKVSAAREAGVEPLILKRPEEEGFSLEEAKRIIFEMSEIHG